MSLEEARSNLRLKLLDGDTAFEPDQQKDTLDLIDKWWTFYKIWEGKDTFVKAFNEGRMTIRQGPVSQTYGEYNGKSSTGGFLADNVAYPTERYRTGMDSLKERMNPDNLARLDNGERMKYKHGLHDLSASLCTPNIPLITKQVRWKNEQGKLSDWITIFMPMAQQEDLTLFTLLNLMAKRTRNACPDIFNRVRYISKRMTRMKLAAGEDIGAGLSNQSWNGVPKFKYGLKPDSDLNMNRFKNTLDYKSILPKTTTPTPTSQPVPVQTMPSGSIPPPPPPMKKDDTSTNEIVMCYREHQGERFPLFTRFNDKARAFVCLPDETGANYIQNRRIPDKWALTVEVGA